MPQPIETIGLIKRLRRILTLAEFPAFSQTRLTLKPSNYRVSKGIRTAYSSAQRVV